MDSKFNHYIYIKRAKNSSQHALVKLISQTGQVWITTGLLWTITPGVMLFSWCVIATLVSIGIFYFQRSLAPDKPFYTKNRWIVSNVGCSTSAGFIWGLAPALLFVPDNTFFLVVMVALYTGYISGAQAVNYSFKYSFIGFALGVTIPFMARLIMEGGTLNTTIACLMAFYIFMLTQVTFNMHKQFIKTMQIQYENENLIQELAKEKETVEKAVMAKDQFLASASHDLRQPLNAISLFTDALKPLQKNSKGIEILFKVRQSLDALNRMLHALLDISRLDAKAIDNEPQHLLIEDIIEQLYGEYSQNNKNIDIKTDNPTGLAVYIDPTIIYRILNNLLDNAIKYTEAGEIIIKSHAIDNNLVKLSIQDTGIGIPEDKIHTIFDEFQQLNNPERNREKGLGLGLAIVNRLCNIADIKISINSKVGVGTSVDLVLRRGIVERENSLAMSSDDLLDDGILKNKTILVIDDEKHTLEGMQFLLSSYGCKTITAESLKVALKKLNKHANLPDLIISDLRLQDDQTGIDAIEYIFEEYNTSIPALLITGDTAPDRIIKVKTQKYETLYKPVSPDKLKIKIQKILNK